MCDAIWYIKTLLTFSCPFSDFVHFLSFFLMCAILKAFFLVTLVFLNNTSKLDVTKSCIFKTSCMSCVAFWVQTFNYFKCLGCWSMPSQ